MSKLKVNKKVNIIVNKNLKKNKIFKNKINLINVNYSPKKPLKKFLVNQIIIYQIVSNLLLK